MCIILIYGRRKRPQRPTQNRETCMSERLELKPVLNFPPQISQNIWRIFYSGTDLFILRPAFDSFPRWTLVGWGGCEVVEGWMRGLSEDRFANCHLVMGARPKLHGLLALYREQTGCFRTHGRILSKGVSLEFYTDAPDTGGGSDLKKKCCSF